MSTPKVSAVPVEIDGETYTLRFDRKTVYKLDRGGTRTLGDIVDAVNRFSYSAVCDLFLAGVKHDRPKMTIDDVIDLIVPSQMGPIIKALDEALAPALGDEDDPEDPTPQPTADT